MTRNGWKNTFFYNRGKVLRGVKQNQRLPFVKLRVKESIGNLEEKEGHKGIQCEQVIYFYKQYVN